MQNILKYFYVLLHNNINNLYFYLMFYALVPLKPKIKDVSLEADLI